MKFTFQDLTPMLHISRPDTNAAFQDLTPMLLMTHFIGEDQLATAWLDRVQGVMCFEVKP